VLNGTLVTTSSAEGVSGVTVSVVDATNSTFVYGTFITDANGYFEYTFSDIQPPSMQLVFAGNDEYLAVTSSTVQMEV
jgi:VCBS repeat-containing protein